ncbi:predicted protein [Sclerotinia sclerotiorum 1980 UF-70]|uniref:Immediate-early protein n=2 Tax=Sclerotinia sclerotiorum (strain ATCC 18683 / 1980 / Ss-1) TaxID=665079 RepID=A7EM83_SCLS1|nr:predicted protein [Sclerotinia sclerotiorum 1980 UF-70]APA14503.1 hypothetical protein sscle_13g092730 [Sclerotinia sclerotiorum 1980 UF-70]EDO03949.1 predicted protein [Sclerotinia sclerotiorum 1980 UF-70]
MFAKLFRSSSKDCLQSDDPLTPSQQLREESRRTRSMVTTRGRARELADSPSVNGDSIIIDEGTPVPKRRGRPRKSLPVEDDEVAVTPRPTRSSKKLPVQASDGEVVQASDGEAVQASDGEAVQASVGEAVQASAREDTPKQSPQVIEDISASTEESEIPQVIEAEEEVVKTTTASGDISTLSTTTAAVTMPVAKKHKRFDSAEPEPVPEEKSEIIEIKDDGDESSDDDAPEEVTKNQAAESAKEKEREAARAIEEQEAAAKKKRQEKNANLQRQSEISSKKRKLDVPPGQDEMLPPAQKSKVEVTSAPAIIERGDIEMDEESNTLEGDGTADGRLDSEDIEDINRTFAPPGHLPLPDLLPAEYLEDNDDDTPESGNFHSSLPTRFVKTNKLRHLLEKRPKDKRVGSTTFRVAESRNTHLPPKASNQARSLKESWLQGRAGTKIKANRKPFNQGFIKPKK